MVFELLRPGKNFQKEILFMSTFILSKNVLKSKSKKIKTNIFENSPIFVEMSVFGQNPFLHFLNF